MVEKTGNRKRNYVNLDVLDSKFKESFETTKPNYKDERFWVMSKDDTGNGNAVIRFLPNKDQNELPFLLTYKHNVFTNGKNFIDRCPTTIGEECPVCDWNKEQDRDFVLKNGTYRKKMWICNIMVVADPANPENNGKVFLYEFGKQIYEILKEAIRPSDASEEPFYYFLYEEGADFKLSLRKEAKNQPPSWSRSKFLIPAPIKADINEIDEHLHNLGEVVPVTAYKKYDELKLKYNKFVKVADFNGVKLETKLDEMESKAETVYSRKKAESSAPVDEDPPFKVDKPAPAPAKELPAEAVKASKPKPNKDVMKDYFTKFGSDDEA